MSGAHEATPSSKSIEEAIARGEEVVLAKPNQLLIDIDTREQFLLFAERIAEIRKRIPANVWTFPSPSKKPFHYHIYVELQKDVESEYERLFLQLYLASDPTREMLSWARARNGDPNPTLFFEKKKEEEFPQRNTREIKLCQSES